MKSEDEVEVHRIRARAEFLGRLVPAAWIAAAWIPLQAIYPIAKVLAGQNTHVAITVSASIAISLSIGGAYFSLVRRARAQNQEILRLLRRCSELEAQLPG
jgi:hypothetical protein